MSSHARTASCVAIAALLLGACDAAKSVTPSLPVSTSTTAVATTTPTVPVPRSTLPPRRDTSVNKPTRIYWPERTIASVGQAQDIAPTSTGVYWLSQPGALSNNGAPVTIYEYNPLSGHVTKGPSFTGFIGSPALTDTAGWVWIVVGVGDNVVVKQLDPSTLAIRSSESLPVEDGASPQVNATLTATVDGPLSVAGGEDLWALNPSNGAVEAEFDTGNWIGSMSTDPSGSLLYVDGQTSATGGMAVTEYDAQTGKELERVEEPLYLVRAVGTGSTAATNSGVWVSVRYGMAGGAFELSAHGLALIAPPPSKAETFGTYDQFMGIGSGVSEQTLWLTSNAHIPTLSCADPTTGAVRASEPTPVAVFAPIASGTRLYALASPGAIVVITPPAKCFA
jgi:hypothetical protein